MEVTEVYQANASSTARFVINQGGRWSSKTRSITQTLGTKLVREAAKATIAGPLWPVLKRGVITDWDTVVEDDQIKRHISSHKVGNRTTKFKSGGQLQFAIFQTEKAARASGKRDYLFLNEADNMPWEIAKQLILGTSKQVFIDFNPVAEFWVHEQFLRKKNADWIYSTYRNNRFCPQTVIDDIEDLRHTDPEQYKVYGLGKRGNIQGLIFPKIELEKDWPHQGCDLYALDHGFASSPLSLVALKFRSKEIHGKELIYETGLSDFALIERLEQLNVPKGSVIVVDSAAAQTIYNLVNAGYSAVPVVKGNPADELKTMRGYRWVLTEESANWQREARLYSFAKDRNTGKSLDVPVKNNDHCWDAARYGLNYTLKGGWLPQFL